MVAANVMKITSKRSIKIYRHIGIRSGSCFAAATFGDFMVSLMDIIRRLKIYFLSVRHSTNVSYLLSGVVRAQIETRTFHTTDGRRIVLIK